jgi:uncharacterized protein (TIGR03435 family)
VPASARLFLVFALCATAHGQASPPLGGSTTASANAPQFEVATVKPVDPNAPGEVGAQVYPGGRVLIRRLTLRQLIAIAFRVDYWQIQGGEDWTWKAPFTVEGKPSEAFQASGPDLRYSNFAIEDEHLREMLQALLIERFQLRFSRSSKAGTVYLLEKSGKPLKLKPVKLEIAGATVEGSSFGSIGLAGRWGISNSSMPQLAKFASDLVLHVPVQDRTGLTGLFNYRSAVQVDAEDYSGPAHERSFLDFLAECGLKLKPSKGQVETLVIDHAEQPSPN